MTGRRPKDVLETKAHIKGRTLPGIKPLDIYGEGEMSHRSICKCVVKLKTGQQQV
jgi:hypothetical protein